MGRPLDLEDLVLMTLEAVKLELEIPQVPESNSLVSGSSCQDKFRVGVETQTVDL